MPLNRRTPLPRATTRMNPGKPLAPGKPMDRGRALERRAPMPRTRTEGTPAPRAQAPEQREQPTRTRAPLPRTPMKRAQPPAARTEDGARTRPRPTPRRTGASEAVRELVRARDGGLCVRCGAPAADLDHRQGRGAGGTKGAASERINGAAWLTTLCGTGGSSGCHMWKEQRREEAERDGYRIARNGPERDAARTPIRTRAGWVLHTDDGRRVRCAAPPHDDARLAA